MFTLKHHLVCFIAAGLSSGWGALAGAEPAPAVPSQIPAGTPPPAAPAPEDASTQMPAALGADTHAPSPPDSDYPARFEAARALLVRGEDAAAADQFAELSLIAPTQEEYRLCVEFEALARGRVAQGHTKAPYRPQRSSEELSLLYTSAFLYGFGTSAWVSLQTEPKTFAAAILPFVGLTAASIGGVAIADDYRPFALGVPRSITAGMYLGFGEGMLFTGWQHARGTRKDDGSRMGAKTTATVLWGGATLGALAGGILGEQLRPAPGRVSLVSSAALWSGLSSAFLGAALQSNSERRLETAFGAAAIGYNVGLISSLVATQHQSPSVARVRFVDLGILAGGLLGASSYALVAGSSSGPRGGLGAAAGGMGVGLAVAWWATDGMDAGPQTTRYDVVPSLSRTENDDWIVQLSGRF